MNSDDDEKNGASDMRKKIAINNFVFVGGGIFYIVKKNMQIRSQWRHLEKLFIR